MDTILANLRALIPAYRNIIAAAAIYTEHSVEWQRMLDVVYDLETEIVEGYYAYLIAEGRTEEAAAMDAYDTESDHVPLMIPFYVRFFAQDLGNQELLDVRALAAEQMCRITGLEDW